MNIRRPRSPGQPATARGARLPLLAAALGLATFALVLVALDRGASAESAAGDPARRPEEPAQPVVVAREAVPAGTTLTASLLVVQEVKRGSAPAGAFGSPDQLAGRALRYPLVRGQPVLESQLVGREAESREGLAFAIPAGGRAVAVNFTDVMGAGGLLVPGDRVDVLVSTTLGSLSGPGEGPAPQVAEHPAVFTLLQNVLVLAVGRTYTRPAQAGQDPATLRLDEAEVPAARTVTLAVTAAQAQTLFFGAEHGKLALALRPFGDQSAGALSPQLKLEPAGR